MANPRKVDVSEDRPAEEQEAVRDVDPGALKGPTAAQQEKVAHGDNEYRREQLLEESNTLLGAPRWVATVVLADQDDIISLRDAQRLVDRFHAHEVGS